MNPPTNHPMGAKDGALYGAIVGVTLVRTLGRLAVFLPIDALQLVGYATVGLAAGAVGLIFSPVSMPLARWLDQSRQNSQRYTVTEADSVFEPMIREKSRRWISALNGHGDGGVASLTNFKMDDQHPGGPETESRFTGEIRSVFGLVKIRDVRGTCHYDERGHVSDLNLKISDTRGSGVREITGKSSLCDGCVHISGTASNLSSKLLKKIEITNTCATLGFIQAEIKKTCEMFASSGEVVLNKIIGWYGAGDEDRPSLSYPFIEPWTHKPSMPSIIIKLKNFPLGTAVQLAI